MTKFDETDSEEHHPPNDEGGDKKIPQQTAYMIPCGIMRNGTTADVMPVSTLVDLGLSNSTIKKSFLQSKLGWWRLSKLMVPAKEDQPTKKGTLVMTIPSGSLWLRMDKATVLAPTLRVIKNNNDDSTSGSNPLPDDNSIQLRLGMDFVSMYQGRLDVEGAGGLVIMVASQDDSGKEEVLVPAWRPRSPPM